jgi:hypothetical protein
MPTKPFEPLLYRELAKVAAKEIIDIASPLLQELVNYATNAFQRCQTSSTGTESEDLPVLASYLHIIEMTDGIEVLISQSCPIPAIPLLRSSFEAQLAIDYILEADYQRRSFAWLVEYVHWRLSMYEMLDPSRQRGKEFRAALAADEALQAINLPPMPNLPQAIQNLQSLLGKPNYQIAEAEYHRLTKTRKGSPRWYSFFDGPRSLEELSRHMGRSAQYEFLYRYWSSITHARDFSRYLTRTSGGSPAFKPLRNPKDIKQISSIAASLILHATRKVLGKFRPGEARSIAKWYIQEVRDRYFMLQSSEANP